MFSNDRWSSSVARGVLIGLTEFWTLAPGSDSRRGQGSWVGWIAVGIIVGAGSLVGSDRSLFAQQGESASAAAQTSAAEAKAEAAEPQSEEGQADLDEAMIRRIDAETPRQLQGVITLLESAIAKGLSPESAAFAKKMVGSIQLERAQAIVTQLMQGGGARARQLRAEALAILKSAVESDPELVEALLLITRLNLLPEGDLEEARRTATKAIDLLANDPQAQARAYLVRALSQTDDDARAADFDLAVKRDPESAEVRQARALHRLRSEDVAGAVDDLKVVFRQDPSNQGVAQVIAEQLVKLGQTDDALALLAEAIEAGPSEGLYRLRGLIRRAQGDEDEAMADFGKALELQPKDPITLLQRAEISLGRGDIKAAKSDLEEAIRVEPRVADSVAAVRVRCYIAVEEGRMADAINDMSLIVQANPEDPFWALQLASLYVRDKRPRKAIELTTEILKRDPENAAALRTRGDTLLGLGQHAEAIQDYDKALAAGGENPLLKSGILNNLAWVLATSPNDQIRDGKRAVVLATEAAELTEFQEPHILSTLGASYAEAGDFEAAVRWSTKAVDLGREQEHEQLEQLEEELESFRNQKPWREQQETEENKVPLLPPEALIDT